MFVIYQSRGGAFGETVRCLPISRSDRHLPGGSVERPVHPKSVLRRSTEMYGPAAFRKGWRRLSILDMQQVATRDLNCDVFGNAGMRPQFWCAWATSASPQLVFVSHPGRPLQTARNDFDLIGRIASLDRRAIVESVAAGLTVRATAPRCVSRWGSLPRRGLRNAHRLCFMPSTRDRSPCASLCSAGASHSRLQLQPPMANDIRLQTRSS